MTVGVTGWAQLSPTQPDRNVSEYNLSNTLIIKGYDPVSYFPEGGGAPALGAEAIALDYYGVHYRFASEKNLNLFRSNPLKYEPTYGGWCAWAIAYGSKVDIQPQFYILKGNRLHLFVSRRARDNFAQDVARYEREADQNWRAMSGEAPRL